VPRRRFAVALLPPPELAVQVDALRRLLEDRRLARLAPHLTLVPPVNLDDQAVAPARAVLDDVAATATPFELELGPAASFAPRTPTVHLVVDGELTRLAELRDRLRRAPFDRPDEHDFQPHVTLRQSYPAERIPAALQVLTGTLGPWQVDRVHLLEHVQDDLGGPRWVVAMEAPFGAPEIVGRGGIELRLRTLGTLEPQVAQRWAGLVADERPPAGRLVVVAESTAEPGVAVGVAVGSVGCGVATVEHLEVDPAQRRTGIARHLMARACTEAARRGATTVLVEPASAPEDPQVLDVALGSFGFVSVQGLWLRRCGAAASN
jgi:2'-5' RNA ligase/predicted GNAT family acetyltransferase